MKWNNENSNSKNSAYWPSAPSVLLSKPSIRFGNTRGTIYIFLAIIYYDFRRGLSRQEWSDQVISTFGYEAPSYATMKRWCNEFNHGCYSLTDEFRKGRPKSVVGPENINTVQKLTIQDRHVTYCEIEATLGISSTSIYYCGQKLRWIFNLNFAG